MLDRAGQAPPWKRAAMMKLDPCTTGLRPLPFHDVLMAWNTPSPPGPPWMGVPSVRSFWTFRSEVFSARPAPRRSVTAPARAERTFWLSWSPVGVSTGRFGSKGSENARSPSSAEPCVPVGSDCVAGYARAAKRRNSRAPGASRSSRRFQRASTSQAPLTSTPLMVGFARQIPTMRSRHSSPRYWRLPMATARGSTG